MPFRAAQCWRGIGQDVRVRHVWRRRNVFEAGAAIGMSVAVGCSGKYYWTDVRIESVQSPFVCFQVLDRRAAPNYPPDGRVCMDATGVDLSGIAPGSCVAAELTAAGPRHLHAVGRTDRPCK